ncbi:MAG TPA: sigma-70 family RNA polymerase sigma factor [Myxococcota bacterium]|nr:sigma-70 family RNA polymerase sigma factor [Myxococcota bacterium]
MSRASEPESAAPDALAEHRALLFRIAYRMLGSASDADDVLQEVALRWLAVDRVAIHQPRAWLISVCSRLCINQIRRTKRARETYVGPWLPEPVASERADALSLGALLRLQRLKPAERIALVLHEAVGMSHGEIAAMLGRTPVACRQALARARRKLRGGGASEPLRAAAPEQVDAFRAALGVGDARALVALLADDAALVSDGGGRVLSALRPIRRADRIARFLLALVRKGRGALRVEGVRINGASGLALRTAAAIPFAVFAFEAAPSGAIAQLLVVRNPDKLRAFARSAPAAGPRAG